MTLQERRQYEKNKYYNNKKYIIDRKIRTFFKDVIRKNIKSSKYELILGYTITEFKENISSKFENWMNWNNFGEWQIDHIIPKKNITYENFNNIWFKLCWSLFNLRPLHKVKNNKRKRH